MIRAGVIGLGMGKNHLHGYSKTSEVKIWAIADLEEERLKSFSQEYSVPHSFKDYRELLKLKELDVVSIALPNFLHCPVTIEALEAGKDVLVEKPMALNSQEAEKMVKVAREEKREPSSSGEKGLRVMRILDAIYESAKTGREVRVG